MNALDELLWDMEFMRYLLVVSDFATWEDVEIERFDWMEPA